MARSTAELVTQALADKSPNPPLLQAATPGRVAWSSRGNVLAVYGTETQFWNPNRWELVGEARGGIEQPIDGTDRFVVREGEHFAVWDGLEGKRLFELEGSAVGDFRFTRTGGYAHSGAMVWELERGHLMMRGEEAGGPKTFALREDGRELVRVVPDRVHSSGGDEGQAGRLVVMAVPSGKVLRRLRIPFAESVYWPRPDTIVLCSNQGLWVGSPNGGFVRMARGAGALEFSRDFQKVAFLPFEAPGLRVIGLAGRKVIAERREKFVHRLSPTLQHWLRKNDPQAIDERDLELQSVNGGRSVPLTGVYGWSGDGSRVLLRSGGSVQALDVRDVLRKATAPVAPANGREPNLPWQPRPGGRDGVFGGDAWGPAGQVLRWSPAGLGPLANAERLSIGAARFLTQASGWVLGSCWTDQTQFDGRSPDMCRSSFLGWFDARTGRPLRTSTARQPTLLWPDRTSGIWVGEGDPSWGCVVGRNAPATQSPGVPAVRDCPVERWSLRGPGAAAETLSPACPLTTPDGSLGATYETGEAIQIPCPRLKSSIDSTSTRLSFSRWPGGPRESTIALPTPWLSSAGALGGGAWYACGAPLPAECDESGSSDCWVWTLPSEGPPRGFRPQGPMRRVGTAGELAYPVEGRLRVLDARTGEASAAWPQQADPDVPVGGNFLPSPHGGFLAIERGAIFLWRRCGAVLTVEPALRQIRHPLRDWSFSDDESLLAWIDDDGLTVVSTESLRAIRRVPGLVCGEWLSGGTPRRLSFRQDGRVLLVACDASAVLVRVDRPETLELQAVRLGDSVGWLAVAPDGSLEGTDGVLSLVRRRTDGTLAPVDPVGRNLVSHMLE
ncbi:MAG: hypothetical protein JW940_04370 [Polyangiaceae bacterium]|nr:hypothetical protein [Polyangiaceae bacterium]